MTRTVHQAVDAWSRGVFGAPRRMSDLLVSIEVRDEVLERVVTEIVRREVREQRLPCNRRDQSPPRIAPHAVDPFEVSTEALRAKSEYVSPCGYCAGAGVCPCGPCGSSGRARCGNCAGSGKEVKYYQKSSRLINCKVCRASGTVRCGGCGGSGSVTCTSCAGSGHQLVWLTYEQESRWVVLTLPESPIVIAHPQLAERRFLAPGDLEAFSVLVTEQADGPVAIHGYRDAEGATLHRAVAGIDPRLERVNRQQYLRLAVVRRDATYEMCGTTGRVVLSGKDLAAARTNRSVEPIKRRMYAWGASALLLWGGTAVAMGSLRGTSRYFTNANQVITLCWSSGAALAVLALGAVLRAWRPGMRFAGLRRFEKVALSASAVAFVAMVLIGVFARPRVGEVDRALAANNVVQARLIVEALRETKGATREVQEADDAVLLAEANAVAGEPRLKILDDVAARHGNLAGNAAALARTDRLGEIRRLVETSKPDAALAAVDRWFGTSWKLDAEVAEAKALAHDLGAAQCADIPCRLHASSLAVAATSTTDRVKRSSEAHDQLVEALSAREVTGEEPLVRVKRLRALSSIGTRTVEVAAGDNELAEKAKAASTWADGERAKVSLIGAEVGVIEVLLGSEAVADGKFAYVTLEGARVYLVVDPQKKCRGLYAVGPEKGKRGIQSKTGDRLLSQAIGRAATVKRPTPPTTSAARWFEVSAQVTARWDGNELAELRVGDGSP